MGKRLNSAIIHQMALLRASSEKIRPSFTVSQIKLNSGLYSPKQRANLRKLTEIEFLITFLGIEQISVYNCGVAHKGPSIMIVLVNNSWWRFDDSVFGMMRSCYVVN